MSASTRTRPSYLGLLNAIAASEMHGYRYLTAWSDLTADETVRTLLVKIAAREAEHGMTFARRVNELGFDLRDRTLSADEVFRAEVAGSDRSDQEKFELLGYSGDWDPSSPDLFDDWFRDHTIDPVTGALLGRFIAEERDSERLLRDCSEALITR